MSNLLAAVGRGQLRILAERVRQKRKIFDQYQQALGHLPGITFMPEAPWGQHTRWLTTLTIDPLAFGATREDIRLALQAENIESRPLWKPMHLQPVYQACEVFGGSVAETLFEQGLCLPSGTQMTPDDIRRVVSVLRRFRQRPL